ncbi:metallophosphoesterase family protein [Pontibacter harenae]|uniref:metallophosphoesterase family protein n=1 Tax=Pontibacter harenae TaxID=2894083 RepID=UPI001E32E237|nr:metallophosphoesterase [Pontibacter harenae]MCC9166824.1 metallophosphoesterase [Pontibacter harenae]
MKRNIIPYVLVQFVLVFLLSSCEKFEYSPYEVRLKNGEKDLNAKNVARIEALNLRASDTVRFVLTGDTQGFYGDNDAMVAHVNTRNDVAFVLHGGDITDFGLLKEHKLIHRSLRKLKVPCVAVVGNHDATNNGKEVYQAMYGDFDFSFTVGRRKFIFLNTNYLEFDKQAPNLSWLEQQFADTSQYDQVFVVSHIPPTSNEFGKEKSRRYEEIINKYKASFSIHGHNHSFDYYRMTADGVVHPQESIDNLNNFGEVNLTNSSSANSAQIGVEHIHVPTTSKREYIVMTAYNGGVEFERVAF